MGVISALTIVNRSERVIYNAFLEEIQIFFSEGNLKIRYLLEGRPCPYMTQSLVTSVFCIF